jgi:arylsulfatase A-like enzyme
MKPFAFLLLCSLILSFIPLKAAERPNILFILADDLGWKDTGFMGSDYFETPHLDELAARSLVFKQAYAGAANCAPSRACLMTGQQSPRHGIYTVSPSDRGNAVTRKLIPIKNINHLDDEDITLAELIKELGYQTCQAGKWHLGDDSRTQGFDRNIGGWSSGSPIGGYFAPWDNPFLDQGEDGEYLTDRITTEALTWLKDRDEKKPFFLYLPYYAVHTPLQAKPELIAKYEKKGARGEVDNPVYAGMVENMDTQIGRVLEYLEAQNLVEDTLIIFSSDNGGIRSVAPQDPLRAGKGSYYEGGIRVPMTVAWPGHIKPGVNEDAVVTFVDWMPTLMSLLNHRLPERPLDGIDFSPILLGDVKTIERSLYYHFPFYLQAYNPKRDDGRDPLFRTRPGSVIRKGNWKLHEYFEDAAVELYDLDSDLGETNNVATQHPEKAKELYESLKAWRTSLNAGVPTQPNPDYDPVAAADFLINSLNKKGR